MKKVTVDVITATEFHFDGEPIPPRRNFALNELRQKLEEKTPIDEAMDYLPYGIWTCADGREVLFNRAYLPLLQRQGGVVSQAKPGEWVPHTNSEFFFDDWSSPRRPKNWRMRKRCEKILREWVGRS